MLPPCTAQELLLPSDARRAGSEVVVVSSPGETHGPAHPMFAFPWCHLSASNYSKEHVQGLLICGQRWCSDQLGPHQLGLVEAEWFLSCAAGEAISEVKTGSPVEEEARWV